MDRRDKGKENEVWRLEPDEGFLAETKAKTVQQEPEVVDAALQYAASFHCLVGEWKDCEEVRPKPKAKGIVVDKKCEETKHRTEWCDEANKYRCMRCGGVVSI